MIIIASFFCFTGCKPSKEKAEAEFFKQDSVANIGISYKTILVSWDSSWYYKVYPGIEKDDSATIERRKSEGKEETTISYIPYIDLHNQYMARSKREMWTKKTLANQLDSLRLCGSGGLIILNIKSVLGGEYADMKNFNIIIHDSSEKELYRKEFEPNPAYNNSSSIKREWINSGAVSINKRIETPFYIYVIEKSSTQEPFKFKVIAVKK